MAIFVRGDKLIWWIVVWLFPHKAKYILAKLSQNCAYWWLGSFSYKAISSYTEQEDIFIFLEIDFQLTGLLFTKKTAPFGYKNPHYKPETV